MKINIDQIAPRQNWIGRGLRWPLDLMPKDLAVPIVTGPLMARKWIVGAGIHRCWLGTYERKKQKILKAHLEREMIAYDVGANAGFYTLLMSRRVGPKGKVYSFEPDTRNLKFIRLHVTINAIQNVVVRPEAVSDTSGQERFSQGQSAYQSSFDPNSEFTVPTVALDELIHSDEAEPPDLIKIDVEGAEAKVLRGALRLMRRFRPTVFLATHGLAVHKECCALLVHCGYRLRTLEGSAEIADADEIVATNR